MSDVDRILELIEEGIAEHGGDLGGWTLLKDNELRLFDGRVTLRAEFRDDAPPVAHVHVKCVLREHDDEVLDACLIGMGDNLKQALGQAARVWIIGVAGPIKSFIDRRPVCMTCQAGAPGGEASLGIAIDHVRGGIPIDLPLSRRIERDPGGDRRPWGITGFERIEVVSVGDT